MSSREAAVSANGYFEITDLSTVSISPDGSQIAFIQETPRDEKSYDASIHVVSVEDGTVRKLTETAGAYTEPTWSPGGEYLAFIGTSGEMERDQLWLLPAEGGQAEQLTNVVGDVSSITWAPSGDRLAFVQQVTVDEHEAGLDVDVPDEYEREVPDPNVVDRTIYRGRGSGWLYDRLKHIYTVDVDDGDVTPVTEGDIDYKQPDWGDNQTLYFATKRTGDPDDNQIHDIIRFDIETGAEEVLVQSSARSPTPRATHDGKVAYIYVPNTESDEYPDKDPGPKWHQPNLQVYHPSDETITTPTKNLDREVYGKSDGPPFAWGPDSEDLYFLTPDEGTVRVRRVNPRSENADDIEDLLGGDDRHIQGFDVGEGMISFIQSTWDNINDIYASDLDGDEVTRLTGVNDEYLERVMINQPEEIWFESEDVEVQGWFLTPEEPPEGEGYPLAVNIHGGPIHMWTTSGTMWHEFQMLAARGYAVFWCNPRGSSGYGEEFMSALSHDYRGGGPYYRDLMAGVDEVSAFDSVDETNMFVTGGSFGGSMTAWMIAQTNRFKAAVPQRGVYDEFAQYGAKDTYNSLQNQWGVPWENHDRYWEVSPISKTPNIETPTLILHSEEDYRVLIHNAELLYRHLRKLGVETRFVRYPREGHGLSRSGEPAHVVDRLERIVRWFDGYSDHHDVPPAIGRGDEDLTFPSSLGK